MSKVFIIQNNGRLNFEPAAKYGKLVPIIERDVFPDDVDERVEAIKNITSTLLNNFNPEKDYILLTGDPVAIVIVSMFLVMNHMGQQIRCLKYDRENQTYYVVEI